MYIKHLYIFILNIYIYIYVNIYTYIYLYTYISKLPKTNSQSPWTYAFGLKKEAGSFLATINGWTATASTIFVHYIHIYICTVLLVVVNSRIIGQNQRRHHHHHHHHHRHHHRHHRHRHRHHHHHHHQYHFHDWNTYVRTMFTKIYVWVHNVHDDINMSMSMTTFKETYMLPR